MMFTKTKSKILVTFLMVSILSAALLAACSPAAPAVETPAAPAAAESSEQPRAEEPLAELPTQEPADVQADSGAPYLSIDTGSLASGLVSETIPAVTDAAHNPYWEVLPEYTRITLQDYPISDHLHTPRLYIYPVEGLAEANEEAGKMLASLQSLLESPREIENMPFLPLFNAAQVMHTHVQYLDFANGSGLRYLIQFDQAPIPVNNHELFYTFQGLTADGKYYLAAVLPVTHPDLPADGSVSAQEIDSFIEGYESYLAELAASLNQQAAGTFTPDLNTLDAMLSSVEIR